MNISNIRRPSLAILASALASCLPFTVNAQMDDALPELVKLITASDDAQFQLDLLKGMSDGLKGRRNVKMPVGWEEAAEKLSKSSNPQVRELSRSLSVTFGSTRALEEFKATLLNAAADAKARQAALAALLAAKDPALPALLVDLLKDTSLRAGALRGLAAYDDARTPGAILEAYPSFSAVERKDALNTLVSRSAFAKPLLAAVAARKIHAGDLTAELVRQLRAFKDPEINAQVTRLWGSVRDSDTSTLKDIERFKHLVTSRPPGDARQGRAVFARVCQQCHTLFDTGGKVGPDITGSNRGDLDYILQNIVDPNAVIPNDYRTWNLETKDDRVITGLVSRQDDNAVTIVTANETLIIPRSEIASLSQGELSMMPEGLLQALTDADVCDLIAYLKQPAQVPLPQAPPGTR